MGPNNTQYASRVTQVRQRIFEFHMGDEDELRWREESKNKLFISSYVDNEVYFAEEEKKFEMARTKESLPFGMNIRKAAYKASYRPQKEALQRYFSSTDTTKQKVLVNEEDEYDELLRI